MYPVDLLKVSLASGLKALELGEKGLSADYLAIARLACKS